MYFLVQFAFSLPLCTMCKLLYLENFLKKYPEQLEPTNLVLRVVKYFASENIQDTSEMSEWKVLDAKQYQVDPKENRMCIWRGQTFQICPPRTNTNPNMTRKWHSAKIGNTFHPIDAAQCCIVEYSIHLKFFAASLHSFPSILGFYVGCMRHRTTESPIIHFYDFGYWAGSSSPSWSGQNHFWESAQKQPPIVPPHRLCKVCAIFNRQANTISASVGQFGFNVSLNCGLLPPRMLWWWQLPPIVDQNILTWGQSQFLSPFVHYVIFESIHCHHDHRLLSDFSDLLEV